MLRWSPHVMGWWEVDWQGMPCTHCYYALPWTFWPGLASSSSFSSSSSHTYVIEKEEESTISVKDVPNEIIWTMSCCFPTFFLLVVFPTCHGSGWKRWWNQALFQVARHKVHHSEKHPFSGPTQKQDKAWDDFRGGVSNKWMAKHLFLYF